MWLITGRVVCFFDKEACKSHAHSTAKCQFTRIPKREPRDSSRWRNSVNTQIQPGRSLLEIFRVEKKRTSGRARTEMRERTVKKERDVLLPVRI